MDKSFIEVQFPVSKISKESYKERKAGAGQTLTGLGKWWGRKPLILVRSTILGLLFPSTEDPHKDREIFLKILGMDDEGMWDRLTKMLPIKTLYEIATPDEKNEFFIVKDKKILWKHKTKNIEKVEIQKKLFTRMSYDQKLGFCMRPEELSNLNDQNWTAINAYLKTNAQNLQELIQELSIRRYGEIVTVGDCFSGGGSIPFEAARLGLNSYGSDLNPIATLLTWAALNFNSCSEKEIEELREFQNKIYSKVVKQIFDWEIEINEEGWQANSYLYCNEAICPSCGWLNPLAPSWVVGKTSKTIAVLEKNSKDKNYLIKIKSNVSENEISIAEKQRTIEDGALKCLNCNTVTPITSLRKDRKDENGDIEYGLRPWQPNDFLPQQSDVFQERLYCIRYDETVFEDDKEITVRHYIEPTVEDIERERKVEQLLKENFAIWQEQGYIPSDLIEDGEKTKEPIRDRGWRYWHQLFNPRQLLINGLFLKTLDEESNNTKEKTLGLLGVNRVANWNSKLSRWNSGREDNGADTYYNQALNTIYNWVTRTSKTLQSTWISIGFESKFSAKNTEIRMLDARNLEKTAHFWITDPPYADAVNYHELSEFFLAWDKKTIKKTFSEWYAESKRRNAVKGSDSNFTKAMIEVYRNLSNHMPNEGMQVVMFTHQDPAVWAELSLILWSAGLQVTAAWNIATETDSVGIKSGNYVKGTVLLVLRKNMSNLNGWLDDIYPQIKDEVKNQIDSMQSIDDKDDPDFTDNDYLLAAYAASLKILTKYKKIGDIDIEYEISKIRDKNSKNPIQLIIESAIKVAYDYLIPTGISKNIWKELTKEEKFYIKGLDFERSGVFALSAYQELARGLGVNDYSILLASTKANNARVKTPDELTNKLLNNSEPFSKSLIRQVLMAIYLSIKDEDALSGKNWFRNEIPDYWSNRSKIIEILKLIQGLQTLNNADHWQLSAQYAGYLQSLVENDGL